MLKPLVVLLALAAGQVFPSEPPVKMGLWEATNTVARPGQGPTGPGIAAVRIRECVVADSWDKQFFGQVEASFKRSNETYRQGHYIADLACTQGAGHLEVNFLSPEATHADVRMTVNTQGQTATVSSSIDMHFVSASCGSVLPGHPLLVH